MQYSVIDRLPSWSDVLVYGGFPVPTLVLMAPMAGRLPADVPNGLIPKPIVLLLVPMPPPTPPPNPLPMPPPKIFPPAGCAGCCAAPPPKILLPIVVVVVVELLPNGRNITERAPLLRLK
jgi:hypothetical protein